MWVRIDSLNLLVASTTIVSKDLSGPHNGDFSLSVFRDVATSQTHFIMRIQREFQDTTPAVASFFLCSANVTLNEWHHVAVSATGAPAQLYVDGLLAAATPTIEGTYGAGSACNADPTGFQANTTTPSENTNNWLVAASNSQSPGIVANDFFSGSIDELRFRSVGFSQDDAPATFGDGRPAAAAAPPNP